MMYEGTEPLTVSKLSNWNIVFNALWNHHSTCFFPPHYIKTSIYIIYVALQITQFIRNITKSKQVFVSKKSYWERRGKSKFTATSKTKLSFIM